MFFINLVLSYSKLSFIEFLWILSFYNILIAGIFIDFIIFSYAYYCEVLSINKLSASRLNYFIEGNLNLELVSLLNVLLLMILFIDGFSLESINLESSICKSFKY